MANWRHFKHLGGLGSVYTEVNLLQELLLELLDNFQCRFWRQVRALHQQCVSVYHISHRHGKMQWRTLDFSSFCPGHWCDFTDWRCSKHYCELGSAYTKVNLLQELVCGSQNGRKSGCGLQHLPCEAGSGAASKYKVHHLWVLPGCHPCCSL